MQTISWLDYVSLSVSIVALIISLFSLYWNRFKKFKGHVIQSMRATLIWHTVLYEDDDGKLKPMINEPCISLDCEFINEGAKPGKIDDVMLYLQPDTGNRIACYPYLVADEAVDFYLEAGQPTQAIRNFSPVWIPPRKTKHETVFFTSAEGSQKIVEQISDGALKLRLAYSGDNVSTKHRKNRKVRYAFSRLISEYHVSSKQVTDWKNGKIVVLEPEELLNNRRMFHNLDD